MNALILGVLAFIASGVFYFVLMARDSNPEGTRFDAPTASNAWAPATGEAPADPYAAQATSYGNVPLPTNPAAAAPAAPYTAPATPADSYTAPAPQYDAAQQHAAPHLSRIRWRRLRPYHLCLRCRLFRPCLRHRPFRGCRKCRPSSSIRTSSRIPTLRRIRTLRQYRMIRRTAPISSSDFALIPALSPHKTWHTITNNE